MKKLNKIWLGSIVILSSCVGLKTLSLPEDKPLEHYAKMGLKPTVSAGQNDGLLANGKVNIGSWVASNAAKMNVYSKGDTLLFGLQGAGPQWEELVLNLPPTDFSKHQHIVVECKIDGIMIPKMRIDLLDENGRITNSKPQELKIAPKRGLLRYDFNFEGAFYQNWPFKGEVDATRITKVRVNVNGGGAPYYGKIYISNIMAVKEFEL